MRGLSMKDALADRGLWESLRDRPLFIGLDYDGTLTPIVDRPDDARLAPEMREAMARLAARHPLAVVSGRDLADLRQRIGLDSILYAGSHGFDIAAPPGGPTPPAPGASYLPALDAAEAALRQALAEIPGTQVERKRFSVAAHYRQAGASQEAVVRRAVEAARQPGLRLGLGKMVFELRPDVDWHKGAAFRWLHGAVAQAALPIFVGDDVTDEDAFRALPEDGVGVLVAAEARPSAARWRLADVAATQRFLERLAEI